VLVVIIREVRNLVGEVGRCGLLQVTLVPLVVVEQGQGQGGRRDYLGFLEYQGMGLGVGMGIMGGGV